MQHHDLLVTLAETVDPKDLASLRLVCKSLHRAVGEARVSLLTPNKAIRLSQFWRTCSAFRGVCVLDLSFSTHLTNEGLELLPHLAPGLRRLALANCNWLDESGIKHLVALTRLEALGLHSSPITASPRFPDALGLLVQLRELDLDDNPGLTGDALVSVANLTSLTALFLFLSSDDQRSFSPQELQFVVSALPGLCCLALAGEWEWREFSSASLLRLAAQPDAEKFTQAAALDALLNRPVEETISALLVSPPIMSQLLAAVFEAERWPKGRPVVQVRLKFVQGCQPELDRQALSVVLCEFNGHFIVRYAYFR